MERYQNKYRIQSHRMPQWDYSGDGLYFITLVTQNRECNLGQIKNGVMILSDFGKIVNDEWLKSFEIRDELYLDEYVIMPNHLHAIVVINIPGNRMNNMDGGVADGAGQTTGGAADGMAGGAGHGADDMADGAGHGVGDMADGAGHVETHGRASLHSNEQSPIHSNEQSPHQSKLIRKPKSISSFMAGFKSAVNSKIDDYIDQYRLNIAKYNRNNHFFQPNYNDRIIRNDAEYHRIKNYIINNPSKWNDDIFRKSSR